VFKEVERDTGRSGDAILFFDDRTENVEGARACGWTAELIDYTGDTADQLLDLLRQHAVIL
jgi:FMN phosphatase YigB (HAD superfamily)